MGRTFRTVAVTVCVLTSGAVPSVAQSSSNRITILVDAFGMPSALRQDWGFSALVEYGGRRILFDAGNGAFAALRRIYGREYVFGGVGTALELP